MRTANAGKTLIALLAATLGMAALASASASAAAPRWLLDASSAPTVLQAGGEAQFSLTATNIGDAPVNVEGEPVVVTFKLPAGVTAKEALPFPRTYVGYLAHYGEFECAVSSPSLVTCTSVAAAPLPPYESLEVVLQVNVGSGAQSGEQFDAEVQGGELPAASTTVPLSVGAATPFAVRAFSLSPEEENGTPATHGGSHPFQLTSRLDFNQTLEPSEAHPPALPSTPERLRNLDVKLPPGLIGNPTPFPRCTDEQFQDIHLGGFNLCPPASAVGVASVSLKEPRNQGFSTIPVPVFNLTPARGEPARFGFEALGVPVVLDTAVASGRDYAVTVKVHDVSEAADVISSRVVFWGVPGDPRHDVSRGWGCLDYFVTPSGGESCQPQHQQRAPAFLTLPTSCGSSLVSTVAVESWAGNALPAAPYTVQGSAGEPLRMDGCGELPFAPELKIEPETHAGSTPTGLAVDVHIPQEVSGTAEGLAESELRSTTVTLPAGMQVNPAAADGLQACSLTQVGFEGFEGAGETLTGLFSPVPASCPDAAKVGNVTIRTPVLANPIQGSVYLAAQDANPFSSLVAMYIIVDDESSGVLVKLAGQVALDPATGQLTTTFENTPQVPFEDLKLDLYGGPRAPLSTPAFCATYKATATFTPWSGSEPKSSSSSFKVDSGPHGAPCASPLPFKPSLAGGAATTQAGAFAPLRLTLGREDGEQNLARASIQMPPGVLGVLASVTQCPEPQASQGTCGPASLIGHATASVGLGSDPFTVTGGEVFLTGPYHGAPFGLSILTPAKAGPFDLGKVNVRARIEVDPHTAQVTVTTDESPPFDIPHILKGIPLQIKRVNVTVDRPGFTFNPTNCQPLAFTGTLGGVEGAVSPVSAPFQVANCANLKFGPKFAVSTSGKTSKANGASLAVKLTYPSAPFGSQANIKQVKVELPKVLPSRLTTLQKACTAAQFNSNPAGCPAASIIGHAKAVTPLLPVPLEGPAYFVSHGGEAFPSLIMVLQGNGVTLDLVGSTFISKTGITSSTFKTVPDAPVGTFELTLPQGKFSALAANGNLCASTLSMPTEFLAQNGAKINETTPVSVTGCAKKKALTRAQKLAAALKACKKKSKTKRAACQASAHRRYGPSARKKTKGKTGKKG